VTISDIAAVIFDWGGTITPWHDIDPLEQWVAAVDDDDVAARLHDAVSAVWLRSRDEHRSATLEEVFATAGVAHTDEMLAAFYAWWEPHTIADPDAAALFAGLRDHGIRVGVLSNTIWSRAEHERIFERDGLADLIDGAVYTSEIEWTKPHPEAFAAALAAVGVDDPGSAVFVGDRPFDDIYGASAVGMRTILVPHSDIPLDQVGHTEGEPDAVAHRLRDVLTIVSGWRHTASAARHA
jgi:putative hydrolase of the HAD superfamily